MGALAKNAAILPLVEPVPIMPVYSDGLAEVVIANGRLTYVHYILQPTYCGGLEPVMERVVVAKVTVPLSAVEAGRALIWQAFKDTADDAAMGEVRGRC